jgi:hypothetical protein
MPRRRSRRRASAGPLALLAVLGLGLRAGAEEPAAESSSGGATWYAQALARGQAGLNVTHFWSKGPMLRAETVVAGHRVVTIVKGEWYYAYDALSKRGVAIRRDPAAIERAAQAGRPFGDEYQSLLDQGAELVREEEVLGRKTGVLRVTDDRGQRELWVTLDEERLPLRIEIWDRRSATRRFTDYVNWQSGLAIPDDFFEPEPRIALERVELEEYFARTLREGPVGPVPVLYARLLSIRRDAK